jgi:polar amino acid transport system substrate-binding protein
VLAALVAAIVLLVAAPVVAGCSDDESAEQPADATARMSQILGRAPQGLAATVAEEGTLGVAVTEDDPPRSYRDGDELTGFDVEVAKSVAEYLKVQAKLSEQPPEAVPPGLAADRFDVSIGSLAPDLQAGDGVAYTDPYYYTTGQLLVKTGTPKLKGGEALAGVPVGAAIHTVFFRFLRDQTDAQVVAYPGDAEALAALEAGRVEAILVGGLTAAEAVADGRDVELSGRPLFSEPMVFVVKSGEDDLLAVLNAAIAARLEDGTLKELSEAWFGGLDLTRPVASTSPEP